MTVLAPYYTLATPRLSGFLYIGDDMQTNAANQASMLFPAMPIGKPQADRLVISLLMSSRYSSEGQSGSNSWIEDAFIGGVAATRNDGISSTERAPTAIASRIVPTGRTADIAYTLHNPQRGAAVGVGVFYGLSSDVAADSDRLRFSSDHTPSLAITIPAGGIGLWSVGIGNDRDSTLAWTGAPEIARRVDPGSFVWSAALVVNDTGSDLVDHVAEASWTFDSPCTMCAASFAPGA
ncbi:hypothetical protein HW532_18560 [Kaustia mangrovi]|uniref:Uncharacterized protein n=1 Tax=Kaustia mangrovi TaxID=2593653 RepID=A0A7S8C6Z9_9HYPH|nr:hypothetical protein [Kaustia mangrovi]QPC44522.1 hypothetical protein HW532_18560 [Kaustia mangrovi]